MNRHLVAPGILTMETLIDRMAVRPREIFGLFGGFIAEGMPADLVFVDLNASGVVDPAEFLSMGRSTPFTGMETLGRIERTLCNGLIVYEREGKASV